MGTGTISGNVINSGVISPGNPFGTLTIRGNFTQTGNGVFRLELGGTAPGDFGQLVVTGRASLNGTLQLVRVGSFQFMPGDKLVFLTAGSVTGSFSSILNLNTIVNAKVLVLADAVELTGTQGDFVTAACNPNSVAVARALNSAVGDPRASALITFLDNQPTNQLCADFTLISPEVATSVYDLAVSLANVQTANLERRLVDLRQGSHGFSSSGFTINGSTDSANLNVLVAGGYDWTQRALTIGPIASFQYTYVGLNGFTEKGSLAPLKFADQSVDSIRTALGIKASYDLKIGGVLIRPEIRASWQHEYDDTAYSIVASFANGAGNSFTVVGPEIGRDSLLIGAGVAVLWNDRISTYAYYDGELARTNYDSQSVSAGFRITF